MKRPTPLEEGSKVTFEEAGIELTLGQSTDLEPQGWVRKAQAADGRAHVVIELPSVELPEELQAAFAIPGVATPQAKRAEEKRALLALRPAPGPSLEWILQRREGLSLWDLSLTSSLAELFQRIHDAGLLFRRVEPAMFSVGPDGEVSLEQPWMLRRQNEHPAREADVFTAPEIVAGARGDARSDQFSLATLAYALLTGRVPFQRADLPLPRVFRPSLPHGVASTIARAANPIPSRRYESCRAFAQDLRARTAPKGKSPSSIKLGGASEIGRLKCQSMPVNQDAWFFGFDASSRRGIVLVADGVSTADVGSGDLASSMVREAVRSAWEGPVGDILREHKGPLPDEWAKAALEAILEDANARIYAFLKQPIFVGSLGPSTHPPGSTAVLGILEADKLTIANLGDSRLYLLRDGMLEQMTVDQDLRTELLQAGRDPRAIQDQAALGALTHSVGSFFFDHEGGINSRPLEADVKPMFLRSGDRILICSDGVPDCLGEAAEETIARELANDENPEAIARQLCKLADEALGGDNMTALVLLAS
jgi:serine/threonine protein phosphatase PrpC